MSMQHPRNLAEWQKAVERALKAGTTGVQIAIAHGTDEAQVVRDEVDGFKTLQPTAPVELDPQTSTYINSSGKRRGRVIVGFPPVTLSTTAEPLTVSNYQLAAQAQDVNWIPTDVWRIVASADGPSLMAMDFDPGTNWLFKARAQSGNFTVVGQWSEEVGATIVSDTTPPPQTSTPVGSVSLGAMKVAWDGKAAGGGSMPSDLQKVELAFGLASSPTTIIDTYYSADPTYTMVPKSAYNVPHYFRLRAVDTSGNIGPWSTQISLIPVPLVDMDIIQSVLDGAKLTIGSVAGAALVDQAVTAAKLQDNAVEQTKLANLAVSLAKMAPDATTKIQKGIDDAFTADSKAYNAQLAADKAKLIADNAVAQAQNTVPDSTFDLGSERWDGQTLSGSTSAFITDATAHRGTKVVEMTAPANATLVQVASDYWQPVVPGQIWEISAWVRVNGTLPTAGKVDLACITKSDTGVLNYPSQANLQFGALTNTVQKMVGYYTVPAGIAFIAFRMRLDQTTTAGTKVQWSDVAMRDVTTAKSALDAAAAAQADATQAIGDASVALGAANGKNKITNSIVDASAGVPGTTTGDRWQKWTTLAIGGKMLATWRWNGTTWIAEAMDATYLPLIDIGAGTFGTLKGNQFASNTISVKNLLVGSFDNVIPDPYFTNANLEWGAASGSISFPATEGYGGLSAFKQTPNASQTGRYSQRIPVEAGSSYRVQVWVKSDVAIPAGALGMYHNYAVAGSTTPLSATNFLKQTTGATGNDAIAANTWTLLTGTAKMNALADTVQFGFYKQTSFTTGTVWFSQASAVRMGDGNLLVDGSVTALAMAANSVSAKNIIIGDFQNFALGSDFEDATAVPWTLATKHTLSTGQKKSGTQSLRLASDAVRQESHFIGDLRVKEGEQYYFKWWAYIDATFNGTGNTKIRVSDTANTSVVLGGNSFNAITRSTWVPVEAVVTVPAGCISLTVDLWSDNTAGLAYVDDIQIRRMAEASLIQNLGVEKLIASAASINSAVIDKLWTDVVNSRKITTDMLVVTAGTNMVPDPAFTTPESRAKKTANNATGWDTYVSGGGIQAIRYGNATPSWPSVGYLNLFDFDSTPGVADKTNWIPVLPGEVYEFGGRFYANDAGITTKMYVSYLLADGTTSGWSSPTISPNITPDGGANRSPVWEFTIPANAIKMGARIEHRGTTGWVSMYGDSTYLHKKVDANLVVDGAILAKHLTVTDEMWTDIIHFKKIGGGEIDANDIVADTGTIGILRGGILINDAVDTGQLKATAITSKHTITGAKFQTTTTANRGIKFDVNGLKMWDAASKLTMDLNASTGYATMTGRLRTAPDGQPGVILLPSAESDDGVTMATWFTPDTANVPGLITAGVYMANPADPLDPTKLYIRGHQHGGVGVMQGIEFFSATGSIPYLSSNHGSGMQITTYNGTLYLTSLTEVRIKSSFNTVIDMATSKQLSLLTNGAAYNRTLSGTANTIIHTDGNVFKVSSASKYKILPLPMALDDGLLDDVTVKDWIDLGMAERYAESFETPEPWTEDQEREFRGLSLERIPGAIAEDVQAAGGERFVVRDLDGEIDSLMYDRFALARTEILKNRFSAMAQRVQALEDQVAAMTS